MSDPIPPAEAALPARRPARRQTQSYLTELLAAQGLRAKRDLGQNFLIDLNLLDLLVRSAKITKNDVVLEVGMGTGGLTSRLVREAGHVVGVELDNGFFRLVSAEVEDADNITLLNMDVLEGKNVIEPRVYEALRAAMQKVGTDHFHLVANLPYDVASAVIANALLHEVPVRSMTFTVQFEVGLRIVAEPGDSNYGPLSVLARTVGSARIIRTLPPSAFWPRPKVDSAFVRLEVDPQKRSALTDLAAFHSFIRFLFIHRRKNLRGSIVSTPAFKPLKKEIPEILEQIGLSRDDRAEKISADKLYELYKQLNRALEQLAPEGSA